MLPEGNPKVSVLTLSAFIVWHPVMFALSVLPINSKSVPIVTEVPGARPYYSSSTCNVSTLIVSVLLGQEGPQLRGAQAKAHKQLARTKLTQLQELEDYSGDLEGTLPPSGPGEDDGIDEEENADDDEDEVDAPTAKPKPKAWPRTRPRTGPKAKGKPRAERMPSRTIDPTVRDSPSFSQWQ